MYMATATGYQRLRTQEQQQDTDPIALQITERRLKNRTEHARATSTIQQASQETNRQPAYVRRIENRLVQAERKVEQLEDKAKKNESKRDKLAECAGRCVSATLRTIAYPFWWLGVTIAKASGCKR